MEFAVGCLFPMVLLVGNANSTPIVQQLKALQHNNAKLGANIAFLMEYHVQKHPHAPRIQPSKLAQIQEQMAFAFGNKQMANQIKEHADYKCAQMLLQTIIHIMGVHHLQLTLNVLLQELAASNWALANHTNLRLVAWLEQMVSVFGNNHKITLLIHHADLNNAQIII